MNTQLFRADAETRDTDIYFSHVGPGHERAYFSLIPIAGYAAVGRLEKHPYFTGPFSIYDMAGKRFGQVRTIPAGKRAVRKVVQAWLAVLPDAVEWKQEETAVHFTATANGIQIANYYYCPEPKGNWHAGFRVWFGGTYYVTDFASPDEAREAVADTYKRWLAHARACLLK